MLSQEKIDLYDERDNFDAVIILYQKYQFLPVYKVNKKYMNLRITPNRTLPFYKTTCCSLRKHFLLAMSTFWQTRIMRHLTLISVLTFSLNAHKLDRTKKRGNGNIKTKPSIGLKQTTHRRGLSKYYVFCVGDKMIYHVSGKQCRFGAYFKVQDVFKLFSHTSVFTCYYVRYIAYQI